MEQKAFLFDKQCINKKHFMKIKNQVVLIKLK